MAGIGSKKIAVGHKIRAAREFKDISQDYLAKKLGISQPALSKIENNETKIDFEKVEEIASILGVDVNDMLNFDKANVFNNCNQSGTFSGVNNSFTFTGEDLKDVYEKLLEEKEKRIQLLEELLKSKK
nr:helix-turn-helix transcriptional regulator [uncultured Fluviicola sp.]